MAGAFYREVVAPLLEPAGIPYAAARLGSGSDVLGFDDEMSRDHDWGCRLTILLDDEFAHGVNGVRELLERALPETFLGLPVRFPTSWEPDVTHKVQVDSVSGFAASRLGVDQRGGLSVVDWLALPGQNILEITAGPVFHDETAQLAPLRSALKWYPSDVELYVLSSAWQRLSQWMPIVGRTAQRGQELQSRLLSARLADDLMHLGFLLCRKWPPYRKWREAAFPLQLPLAEAAGGADWREREAALVASALALGEVQRAAGLPTPDAIVTPFWGRPYRTVDVAQVLFDAIEDPEVKRLPFGVGSIEQWVDSVDVLSHPDRRGGVIAAYRAWLGGAPAGRA